MRAKRIKSLAALDLQVSDAYAIWFPLRDQGCHPRLRAVRRRARMR